MKRVLFVDHVDRILGGAELNLVELLAYGAVRDCWETACACRGQGALGERLAEIGVSRHEFGFPPELNQHRVVGPRFSLRASFKAWRALAPARQRLIEIMREVQPHAVISCTNKDHFAASAACSACPAASIWWVNDIVSRDFLPWPARAAFHWRARRGARRLVTVSEFARQVLINAGFPARRVATIRNGIPLDRYRRQEENGFRKQWKLPLDARLVGCVGRLTAWKGQELFLALAEARCRMNSTDQFVLVGQAFNEDQPFEQALRNRASGRGIGNRVHFIPFQNDIIPVMSALDVVVHTSLRPEPFGRVIIEAMALNVPVIAARAGGVTELITDDEDGLLAEPGDVTSYLARLGELLASPDLAARLATRARQTVAARFDIARVAEEFKQLVKGL